MHASLKEEAMHGNFRVERLFVRREKEKKKMGRKVLAQIKAACLHVILRVRDPYGKPGE